MSISKWGICPFVVWGLGNAECGVRKRRNGTISVVKSKGGRGSLSVHPRIRTVRKSIIGHRHTHLQSRMTDDGKILIRI